MNIVTLWSKSRTPQVGSRASFSKWYSADYCGLDVGAFHSERRYRGFAENATSSASTSHRGRSAFAGMQIDLRRIPQSIWDCRGNPRLGQSAWTRRKGSGHTITFPTCGVQSIHAFILFRSTIDIPTSFVPLVTKFHSFGMHRNHPLMD